MKMNGTGDLCLWNAGRLACVYSRPALSSSSASDDGGESEYSVHSVDSMCVHAASRTLVLSRQGRDLELYAFSDEARWLRLRRELCGDPDELLDLLFLHPPPLPSPSASTALQKTRRKPEQQQRSGRRAREYVLAATNTSSVRVLDTHSLDSRLFAAHSDTVLSLTLHPSQSLLATTSKVSE